MIFLAEIKVISLVMYLSLIFHKSPPIPNKIKIISVVKFKVFKTLKLRFELIISTTSRTNIKINIGTKAERNKDIFFKCFIYLILPILKKILNLFCFILILGYHKYMKMIPFIIFGVLCVAMNVIYTLFNKSKGYKALLIRGLTVLACIGLAFVSANLNSLTNSFPLLILFGLGFMLLSEAMVVSQIDNEKPRMIVFGLLSCASNSMFGISAMSLTNFNIFAFAGGILLGLGFGCVVCAIKKYKQWYNVLTTLLVFASTGFLLAEGVFAVMTSIHSLASILMLVGGVLMMSERMISAFAKRESIITYFASFLYILSAIAIASSIYFY